MMCLLDSVVCWNSHSITCLATSHRDANNPLARDGRLDAICGIEYAAQAMAVHFGLSAGRRPLSGYLASVRDVICHVDRLDLVLEDPDGDRDPAGRRRVGSRLQLSIAQRGGRDG